MTRKQVYRYKCDHCSKAGCNGGHIAKHERRCTANPQRVCGMCALVGETQHTMTELFVPIQTAIACYSRTWGIGPHEPDEIDVSGLRVLTKNCPACMLAALRQFRSFAGFTIIAAQPYYNMKEECEAWFKQYRQSCLETDLEGGNLKFDRGEWLATWEACNPVKPLLVGIVSIEPAPPIPVDVPL